MKKHIYFAFAAALAVVSCAKEQAPVVNNEVVTRIYAAMDPVKSTVGIDGTTAHFSWTSGEVISVATAEGFTDFTCTNTSTGEFTHAGEVTPLNVAVSPAQTTDKFTSETNFEVGLPIVYTYAEGKTNAIMVGTKGEGDKYIFGHAAALLSITYENLPEGTKGISVTADEEIAGIVTLSGTSASAIEIKNDNPGLTDNTVSITHDATVGNTASRTYYLPLPTGTYETITFHLIHDNAAIEASTTKTLKNVTLARGNYAALPAATLAEGFVPYTVGKVGSIPDSEPTSWTQWGDETHSSPYAIAPGQVLHLEFENHSKGDENAHNWVVFLANKDFKTPRLDGYTEYFALRSDNWGWGNTDYNGANIAINMVSDNDISTVDLWWAEFKRAMQNSNVTMTLERTEEGGLFVIAKSVSSDNKTTITESYQQAVPVTGDVVAFLWCDNSYYIINKVWYSNSKKVLSSFVSDYDYYLFDTALDLSVIGTPKKVSAVYNDGGRFATHLAEQLSANAATMVPAEEGNQTVSATYKGNAIDLVIPVKIGTSAFGSTTLATTIQYSPFAGEIPVGETVSKTLFVYSSCPNNWASPCVDIVDFWGEGNKFYASFRMDNYGWGTNYGSATATSNWNWDIFQAMQNHDTVKISWTNNTSTATVRFDATYWNGETHFQQFEGCTIDGGKLGYRCFTENSYVVAID